MVRRIHGQQFLDWLRAEGIIPESTRRVVIDATVGEVVRIYAEQYGSEALISVEPPPELRGATVTIINQQLDPEQAAKLVHDQIVKYGKLNGGLMQ